MKELKRRWVRSTLLIAGVGLAEFFVKYFLGIKYFTITFIVLLIGFIMTLAVNAWSVKNLGCPYCGEFPFPNIFFKKPHCPNCGRPLFDEDEAEGGKNG